MEAKEQGRREIVLWGDGSPTLEFVYVEDVAEGLLLASEWYDGEEPVNLGTGEETSIRDLADMIASRSDLPATSFGIRPSPTVNCAAAWT